MVVKAVVIEPQYGIDIILPLLPTYPDVNGIIYDFYNQHKPEIDIANITDFVKGRTDVNLGNFYTCMKSLAIHGVTKMRLKYVIDYDVIMDYFVLHGIICDTRIIYNKFKSGTQYGFVVISIIGAIMSTILNMGRIDYCSDSCITKDFRQNTMVLYEVRSYQESSIPEAYANMIDGDYTERDNVHDTLCMSYENNTYMKKHDGYTINAKCNNGNRHGMFSKKLPPVSGSIDGKIHSIKANYIDGELEGEYIENINGCITTANYAIGKKHGTYSKISPTCSVETSFVYDKLHGGFVKKYKGIIITASYINGILNGAYSKNSPTHTIESNYVDGKLHDTYTETLDGCVTTINYINGWKHGAYSKKSPTDYVEANYDNGDFHGDYMKTCGTHTTKISYKHGDIMVKKIMRDNKLYIIHKFSFQSTKHVIKLYITKLAVKVTVCNGVIREYDVINNDVVNSINRRAISESMKLSVTRAYINEHWENVLNDL
jgi:hypothetical protein